MTRTHRPKPSADPLLITPDAAAALLAMSPRSLERWRQDGRGPRFVSISPRAVRYRRQDVVDWIEARLRSNTAGG